MCVCVCGCVYMRPETCGVHRSLTVRIVGATTTHPQVQPRLTSRGRAGLPYAETATDYRHVSTAHDGPSAVAAAHLCAHPALCALAHGCCGVAKQISAKGSRSPQEQQHGLTHVSGRHTHICRATSSNAVPNSGKSSWACKTSSRKSKKEPSPSKRTAGVASRSSAARRRAS